MYFFYTIHLHVQCTVYIHVHVQGMYMPFTIDTCIFLVGLVKSAGTLVVCPASLMMQWAEEVKTKLQPHSLKVNIYHGSNRTGFAHE